MTRAKGNTAPLNSTLKSLASCSLAPLLFADEYAESPAASRHSLSTAQFHRVGPDHICLLDSQRDKYWTNQTGKFTVNIGVYFPAIEAIRGKQVIEGIPPGGCWTIATRLNMLATGEDRWWTLTPRTKLGPLQAELQDRWRGFGHPWIERNKIISNARDWQVENHAKWPAVFSTMVLGQRDRALALLHDILLAGYNRQKYLVEESQSLGLISSEQAERLTWALMQDITTLRRIVDETFGTGEDESAKATHAP